MQICSLIGVKVQEVVDAKGSLQMPLQSSCPMLLLCLALLRSRHMRSFHPIPPSMISITSVSDARQVVTQLLDRAGCHARLDGFWVVCDEERLFCLDNHDAFLSLHVPICCQLMSSEVGTQRKQGRRVCLCWTDSPSSRTDFYHPPSR
jgi:hypothetical protein